MPRKSLFAIVSAEFVAVVGFSIMPPMLPLFMRSLGLTVSGAAIIVAVYLGAAFAGGIVLPRLSRRWGRKPVLVGAGLLAAEGLLALSWAGDVPMLVVARLASGVAAGGALVAAASARDCTESADRGRVRRTELIAVAAGLVAGPLLVAMFAAGAPSAPAVASALLAGGGLLAVITLLPETAPPESRGKRGRARDRRHGGRPQPA